MPQKLPRHDAAGYNLRASEAGRYKKEATMIRRALMAGILMVVSAAFTFAADFNGRWERSVNTPNGDVQLVFHFKVDGVKLTGSVETPNGNADIEEGKV